MELVQRGHTGWTDNNNRDSPFKVHFKLSVILKTRWRLTDHRQALSCIELLSQLKLRLSSIFKNIEIVLHILSSWVKNRVHTKISFLGCLEVASRVS
jgi:hypothetical protein